MSGNQEQARVMAEKYLQGDPAPGRLQYSPEPMLRNIHQRLNWVMQQIAYIQKDKRVENYMAVTHDQVTALVRQHFVVAGIIVIPRVISSQMINTGRMSKAGNPALRYEGRFEVDFVNMDEPADKVTIALDAHADDFGDKAPGKALSYAVKGATLKVLYLETGENDESRATKDDSLTEEQEQILQTLRERSLEGRAALKAAWQDLGMEYRTALAGHMDALKEAADKADAGTAAQAAKEAAGGAK